MSNSSVVFIHGAGGGAWQWRDWISVFENEGCTTVTCDLQPGSRGLADTALEDYGDQITATLDTIPSNPVIVGASMGGLLGMKIAEQRPLSALILVNSVPPAGTPGWPPQAKTFPDIVRWSSSISLGDSRTSMPEADEDTLIWAHGLWRDESGRVMKAIHGGVPVQHPGCRTLVIGCGLDNAVPEEISANLAYRWGVDYRIFHNASHVGALLGIYAKHIARFSFDWLSSDDL